MIKQIVTATALTLVAGTVQASMLTTGLTGAGTSTLKAGEMLYEKPASSYAGQHFQNSLGCVYSRTQAPGHPLVWHLLVNTRVPGCPNTVPGS